MGEGEKQPPRVVETASGTTDANNGKSGGFAYVIAVVAIVVSLGVGNGLRGCVNLEAFAYRSISMYSVVLTTSSAVCRAASSSLTAL